MRKVGKDSQYQAPLMSAFREAFEARDAKENAVRIVDGERVIERHAHLARLPRRFRPKLRASRA